MTITVPADLRLKMAAIGSKINWSAVAAKAFDAVIEAFENGDYDPVTLDALDRRLAAVERRIGIK